STSLALAPLLSAPICRTIVLGSSPPPDTRARARPGLGWVYARRDLECELHPHPSRSRCRLAAARGHRCAGHAGDQVQARTVPAGGLRGGWLRGDRARTESVERRGVREPPSDDGYRLRVRGPARLPEG